MFKKYFIPHKENEHQPHILRKRAVLGILVFILLIEGFFLVQIFLLFPNTNLFSSILPNVLIDMTNSDRQQNSVQPLKTNSLLEKAAQLKAGDMAEKGYFAHTSPEGIKPWDWLDKAGYNYQAAGENLAIDFLDSKDIDNAWMNSPSHRANILNNDFTEIGIAAVKGLYNGRETIFVVQFFGRPQAAIAAAGAITKKPESKKTAPKSVNQQPASPVAEQPAEEMTVIVQPQNQTDISGAAVANPLIAESQPLAQSSFWQRIFVMPRGVSNAIYLFLASFIMLALFLKIFIKIKIQYPKLIFNGIILLFITISIFYLNYIIIQPGRVF